MKTQFDREQFESDLTVVLSQYPFFADLSRRITRVMNAQTPTACVYFDLRALSYVIEYSPDFFSTLSKNERCGVIIHELYHVALGHVDGRLDSLTEEERRGIAMDCAVNSLILRDATALDALPACALMPGVNVPFKPLLTTQEYYELLKSSGGKKGKKKKGDAGTGGKSQVGKDKSPGDGDGVSEDTLDDHKKWSEMSDSERVLARAVQEELVAKALENVQALGWGKSSADTAGLLSPNKEATTDWGVLENFVSSVRTEDSHTTYSRVSRKHRDFPGRKRNTTCNVLLAIDASGSVSNKQLSAVYGALCKLEVSVDTVQFDTKCTEPVPFEAQGEIKRLKTGGTDLDAVLPLIRDNPGRWQAVGIITDGCAAPPSLCPIPRFWVQIPGARFDFGETKIEIVA